MSADHHIRSTCRLCASDRLEKLLDLGSTPLANEYGQFPEGHPYDPAITGLRYIKDRFPLYLVGCSSCGHVQLPVVVDPQRLFPPDYPYQSGTSAVFREHLAKLAATLTQDMELGYGRTFLDIACNDGTLVSELMKRSDVRAYGVDPCAPDEPMLMRGFFSEEWVRTAHQGGAAFDCITALNVFAHVDDLDDFTRGVHTLLEPCGLFVVEVGYLPDVVKRGLFDCIYHEHVAYHHLSPLVRFFKRHGMTMVEAHRIDSQGGSIRMYVRNCDKAHQGGDDGHNETSARLQDLLDEESRSALWQGVKDLGGGSAHWGIRRVRDQLKYKAPFAVYGAPAKLTTLLHATGLTDCVSFVADDNPLKQGRYVPGTRIPILPTSALYERKPERVMLASWNFAEDIKQRHAELGCEWLEPLPMGKP
jgi:SAM-dependent methyltransferase